MHDARSHQPLLGGTAGSPSPWSWPLGSDENLFRNRVSTMERLGARNRRQMLKSLVNNSNVQRQYITHGVSLDENYLDLLAIVGTLNLGLFGAAGTQYGDESKYGVTDPPVLGVVLEFLFSTSFFLQWASVLDALVCKYWALQYDTRPDINAATYLLAAAVSVYLLMLSILDPTYWFNYFVTVKLFDLQVSNTAMYVADEIPTFAFMIGMPLWIWRQRLRHRERYGFRISQLEALLLDSRIMDGRSDDQRPPEPTNSESFVAHALHRHASTLERIETLLRAQAGGGVL